MSDTPAATPAVRPFRYGWNVLAIAAVVVRIGAGTRSAPGALAGVAAGVVALVIKLPVREAERLAMPG